MIEKLTNSWELVKASAHVLQKDKELIVFPLVSGFALILVTISFFVPLAFFGDLSVPGNGAGPLAYGVYFVFYVVQSFVIFFCNSALVGAVMIRLDGGNPTLGDGFRIAFKRLGPIFGYAVIASTVGLILKAVSERSGLLGRIVIGLVGFAWNLATYLVVPVLVTHDIGPLEAIQESARTLRKTWGEQLIGNTGIGFVFGLVSLAWAAINLPLLFLAISAGQAVLIGVVVASLVLGFLLIGLINATLSGIYSAALYRFASTGQGGPFATAKLESAFMPR